MIQKNTFFKKVICPECGREQRGYYISPVCLCGHQLRELNGWEMGNMGYSEEEFQTLSVERKREVVRNTAWDWCDIKWHGGFRLYVFAMYLILLFCFQDVFAEHVGILIGYIVVGILLVLDFLGIIVKTIYFRQLRTKDIKFFNQHKGA